MTFERRAGLVLLAVGLVGGCRSGTKLNVLLSHPKTTVRLGVTTLSRGGEWGQLQLDGPREPECSRLTADVVATIDGQAATIERGHENLRLPNDGLKCSEPTASRLGLPVLSRGDAHTFVLTEGTTRFEARLRLVTMATDRPLLEPFPGPDRRWHIEWVGAPPTSALFFGTKVETEVTDGGFDVLAPGWFPTSSSAPALWVTFPVYALEGCADAKCEWRAEEDWMFDLDGGVATVRSHKRFPPPDLMRP